ncbi:MAG: NADH-quinone oxidoreductase subunit N [Gemmatimonadota bacterium]|jgi:NADH-quinone oxidoreductase subunit N|nr:NADH-quinone oxidoreductase subunit N [Gemmatimonadota bacterium]MDQ8172103.1 NADH-quinone oxidoreductase subunit N [Gemmatimonadota bacterium]
MGATLSAGALFRALAPELLLASGAMVLLLASVWNRQGNDAAMAEGAERTSVLTRFAIVLCLLVALVVMIAWGDGVSGTPDLRLAGDGFRWGVDLVILLGTVMALILLDADHHRSGAFSPEVPVLMLLAATGMMMLTAARDLMFVFLGIELMSLALYILAGVNRRSARGAEAAVKYFLLGAVASGFLLYGMALLFGATGSTRLVDIAQWVAAHPTLSPMFLVGTGLLLVGFAFKVAAAPFHLWTPDVYDGAPQPITAFMSACVKTAAFAVFARVMFEALPGAAPRWHSAMWWLAVVTMVSGNVLALTQTNIVRLLAYSSIAHAGYLLVTIVVSSAAGTTALLFYTVSYTLATMGAFGVLITVNGGRDRSPTIDDLAGLWLVRPWLAVSMAVFLLAFLGMPLVGGMGFFAKWYLLQAALQASTPQSVLAVIVVLSSAVSAAYYLTVVSAMFMRPRPEGHPVPSTIPMAQSLITVSVIALLVLGVYPTPMIELARRASIGLATDAVAPGASSGPRLQAASLRR